MASSLFWRNFVYLTLLPFLLCLVLFPPPFLLWHRRLGHMSAAQGLDISFLLECWGLYLTLRFLLIWVANGKRLGPSFIKEALSTSPFDLVSEVHPAPLLSKGGSSVYVFFDRTMKKFTKIKVFRSDSGVYLRCLPNSACFNSLHLQSAFPTILPPHSSAEWGCRAETSPYTYIGDSSLSLALSFCP